MTGDEMRDQLAEQAWGVLVAAGLRDETRGPSPSVIAHAIAENLLPAVRKIAADAQVAGYRTGVADAERGVYVPGSEALAAAELRGYEQGRADALDPTS